LLELDATLPRPDLGQVRGKLATPVALCCDSFVLSKKAISFSTKEGYMIASEAYKPKQYNLSGLNGISDQTLEMHFKLYEGYVKETNNLTARIAEFLKDGRIDQDEMPVYSELKRRLGFEYNGMVLHEYYFGNLKKGGGGDPAPRSLFLAAAQSSFGSYDIWKADFVGVGKMRGVGWAMCYENPETGRLSNHWIGLHQIGEVAGFNPVLVMDVWEHAFLLDYAPADRPKYIEAFFSNIDWSAVENRLKHERRGKVSATR
jgi:Fe-Mn family superoxide dismutase